MTPIIGEEFGKRSSFRKRGYPLLTGGKEYGRTSGVDFNRFSIDESWRNEPEIGTDEPPNLKTEVYKILEMMPQGMFWKSIQKEFFLSSIIVPKRTSAIDFESLVESSGMDLDEVVSRLNQQAQENQPFGEDDMELLRKRVLNREKRRSADFLWDQVRNRQNHGRVRWLLLEFLARKPDDRLRALLVDLLEEETDPWVVMGTAIVIRFTKMAEYRSRVRAAFMRILLEAQKGCSRLGDAIGDSVLGEVLATAGSFAEAEDIPLLGWFVLQDCGRKPRINACDALARTIRRHLRSPEVADFFGTHRTKLETLGLGWAGSWRSSSDIGALLFAWIDLVVTRLGPEVEMMALKICEEATGLTPRILSGIDRAERALFRRGEKEWLHERSTDIKAWRRSLSLNVDAA